MMSTSESRLMSDGHDWVAPLMRKVKICFELSAGRPRQVGSAGSTIAGVPSGAAKAWQLMQFIVWRFWKEMMGAKEVADEILRRIEKEEKGVADGMATILPCLCQSCYYNSLSSLSSLTPCLCQSCYFCIPLNPCSIYCAIEVKE